MSIQPVLPHLPSDTVVIHIEPVPHRRPAVVLLPTQGSFPAPRTPYRCVAEVATPILSGGAVTAVLVCIPLTSVVWGLVAGIGTGMVMAAGLAYNANRGQG